MKKNIKSLFIIVMIVLAFVAVISIVYGIINVRNDNSNVIDTSTYTERAEKSIEKCKEVSSILDDSTEYDKVIEYYCENIENASSPEMKVYEACNMVTYSLNYVSIQSVAFSQKANTNGVVSPYTKYITELSTLETELLNLY